MCREACLHVGDHLGLCQQVALNGALPSLWTWRAGDFVVLTKCADKVVAYVCDQDMVYFAKDGYDFDSSVQALIGQFVLDHGAIGRLLVFDVVADGSPAQRTDLLQRLTVGPNIHKQWVGNRDALSADFLASLPHKHAGLVGLTACPYIYAFESTG